jgi:hypothetical protein
VGLVLGLIDAAGAAVLGALACSTCLVPGAWSTEPPVAVPVWALAWSTRALFLADWSTEPPVAVPVTALACSTLALFLADWSVLPPVAVPVWALAWEPWTLLATSCWTWPLMAEAVTMRDWMA